MRFARDARAIRAYRRVKDAVAGFMFLTTGLAIAACIIFDQSEEGHYSGIWLWIGGLGCLLAGPLLLWKAFRQSPKPGSSLRSE
ncbi:MAG TPA: hypothetical protein VL282_09670 [Tepidisphaeraceae bacterium]|nr:hypothetical protein [Tepidisphaeraceae bacterium]